MSQRWTPNQVAVLRVIAKAGQPVTGADIARALGMNRGNVYPILRRLRTYGLLIRVESPECQPPRWFYGLTPTGRELLQGGWFDELLKQSSLGAPHVRAVSTPIPDWVRKRMAQAVMNKQGEL